MSDLILHTDQPYGPLQGNFHMVIPDGYSVLIGPNNAGKSAILQLIFRTYIPSWVDGEPAGVLDSRVAAAARCGHVG